MQDFNIYTPGNVTEFFTWVNEMSCLNIVAVDQILIKLIGPDTLQEIQ